MTQAEVWTPPENPDAHAILDEAVSDARAGMYEVALAKHLWFHENALSCDSALYGVRLSFALGYWRDLADEHPPAMHKLVETRNKTATDYLESGFSFKTFHDLTSLNRVLNEPRKTAEAFLVAHQHDREAAASIYDVAEPALIAEEAFEICGHYLEPEPQLERTKKIYRLNQELERKWAASEPCPPATARHKFVHRISTLAALLIKNDRRDEAHRCAAIALDELGDDEFKADFDSALAGNVPAPWP
jgi:hypothetical protein